jgi:hypothetical protein
LAEIADVFVGNSLSFLIFFAVDVTLGLALVFGYARGRPRVIHKDGSVRTLWKVASLSTKIIITLFNDVIIVEEVLAGPRRAQLDARVVLFAVLAHDRAKVWFPPLDADALLSTFVSVG